MQGITYLRKPLSSSSVSAIATNTHKDGVIRPDTRPTYAEAVKNNSFVPGFMSPDPRPTSVSRVQPDLRWRNNPVHDPAFGNVGIVKTKTCPCCGQKIS
jgi:hypothetical protein